MFRWHEPTCSKPFVNVVGGLPWCQTCCAVPPVNEDLDFRDDLDPPRPPSRKIGQCRTLAWPPSVKYQKEDPGDEDEDLRIDHIDTDLPLQNASADGYNHLQAPLDGIKTAKHKCCYPFLSPRSIRILDITPGGPDDILHGNFRVIQLGKDSPHYEALSYTWADAAGNSQRCRAMYIGPFWDILPITQNCDHALRSVRPRNDRLMQRTLWIDSVCVNQSDVIERTSQVALMPEIYSSAAEVLVYLGLANDSSNLALEAISRSLTTNDCSHTQEKSICKVCQSAIFELFERPYFRRLWVVQEIILSRSITVFCGALSTSLPFSRMLELLPADVWPVRRVKKPLNSESELLSLMIETSNCICKDPRDKIFALLGIPTEWTGDQVLPDYSRSSDEVAIGIAAYFIQVSNFAWLVLMFAGLNRKIVEHLPTWVPDTETSFKVLGARKQLCDRFLRSSNQFVWDIFDEDDMVLEGKRVVDEGAHSITTETAKVIPLPVTFEDWSNKEIQITSKYACLKVVAHRLCNVHEVFDMESVGCRRDFIRMKAYSGPRSGESKTAHPKFGLAYAALLLFIPNPGHDMTLRKGLSDFILENDELYWLHGAQGLAILRPSQSSNMHTLVTVCVLATRLIPGNGFPSHEYRLRPLHQGTKDSLRSTLEALLPQTGDSQAHRTSLEPNDEVAILELGDQLSELLPGLEGRLWDQWKIHLDQWYSFLADPDFLEHAILELEECAKATLQDKEVFQQNDRTTDDLIKDPRSVAAVLWSILPQQIIRLSPPEQTTAPRLDRDTNLTYRDLDDWAELTHRLISSTGDQDLDAPSINYHDMPDDFKGPHRERWRSSWEGFRTRTGLPDFAWDTPVGVAHVLKLFRGLGTSWEPLSYRQRKTGRYMKDQVFTFKPEVLQKTEAWTWDYMEYRHDFRFNVVEDPSFSWIFRPSAIFRLGGQHELVNYQLAIRRYMHLWGLNWTSMTEITIE